MSGLKSTFHCFHRLTAVTVHGNSSGAVEPTLACDYCDRDGFLITKKHSAIISFACTKSRWVVRDGPNVVLKLPFVGAVQCPECSDSFTGTNGSPSRGSIVKHLKFKHQLRISHLLFHTSALNVRIASATPQGLRNHLSAHKKASALHVATPLTFLHHAGNDEGRTRSPMADFLSEGELRVDTDPVACPAGPGLTCPPLSRLFCRRVKGPLRHHLDRWTISFPPDPLG
ncbi:hypothetical protein CEXT_111171 [Caerostris extrusa]|uniref:C2H2-type domain-containing protein n=1 Tax=Caerostris extrusa TaxID=172846 RepID=A0AAV4MWV5_CAEEX|nr:hypothetical protein CEXT_111171 [Caerostris extrusa]